MLRNAAILTILSAPLVWTQSARLIEPPAVDEARLALRLAEMAHPSAGERAIVVFDPTYYPGITRRLQEELQRRGVFTYVLAEDSETMIASYVNDDVAHEKRENDVIETLRPVFQRSDIFYWMPARGYVDDLRWERLVAESKVRGIHFHWIMRFPAGMNAGEILRESKGLEKACLEESQADQSRRLQRLAAALRGHSFGITTPEGTDLHMRVRPDQGFHFGDGDASKDRAAKARSIRDREIELPVGMFCFIPDPDSFAGQLYAKRLPRIGETVRDVRFHFEHGRVENTDAAQGVSAIHEAYRKIGEDGNKIATVWFLGTNPFSTDTGIAVEIGSNWEPGGTNRAVPSRRITVWLQNATLTAGDRVIMRDGVWRWEDIP